MTFPNQGSSQTFFKNRVKKREELPADRQRTQKIVIRKTTGNNTENNGGLDTMKETQELNRLFKDSDMDCNEENVACENDDLNMIAKNDESIKNPDTASSAETEETVEADLLMFQPLRRKAALPDGKYHAVIKEITAESREGVYGKFVSIRIKFEICYEEKRIVINWLTHKDTKPTGKLFKVIKMVLGEVPSNGFDLRNLKGKEVWVEVGHRVDENGNTWEEVLSAEKFNAN